jgi:general secretion pathway protein D
MKALKPISLLHILLLYLFPVLFSLSAQESSITPQGMDSVGVIRIRDMEANEVIEMLERFTGKSILRQQNLPKVQINFSSQSAMTKADAILAMESLLSLNGIAITEVGEKFLKAVPAASIATQAPSMINDSTLKSTPSQKIYSKFFYLDYLNTEEIVPVIQPLLTQGAPIAFPKANAILVTDPLINLQRIEDVIAKVDQPAEVKVEILFYHLEHVSATDIVKRLQSMQTGSLKRFFENNTTFEAVERSNQLVVFTHHSNKDLIDDLISKLDVDVAPITQTEIFSLKHADAAEVTELIEQVLTGQQRSRDETTSERGSRATARRQTPGQTGPARAGHLSDMATNNLQFSDYLTIVADPRSNSIVASGTTNDLIYLREIVDKIDTLLAQVRIEVVIAEVTLSEDIVRGIDAFNIDFNLAGLSQVNFGVQGPGTTRLPQGYSISGSLKDFSINTLLNTARRNTEVTILSTPTLVTTHNQEASINVAESRPVITATQSDNFGGNSLRSSVQFRDIGIELIVKPLIGPNGIIQMEIDQKVESVVDTITIDGNDQPIIGKRQAKSFLSVADQELIVLGGLQQIDNTEIRGRMAFLGEIPLLGPLFRSKAVEQTKRELLIFIRPEILLTTDDAYLNTLNNIQRLSASENIESLLENRKIEDSGTNIKK